MAALLMRCVCLPEAAGAFWSLVHMSSSRNFNCAPPCDNLLTYTHSTQIHLFLHIRSTTHPPTRTHTYLRNNTHYQNGQRSKKQVTIHQCGLPSLMLGPVLV
ncbi:hypothetical protein CHARACLAT_022851 [Characodon lateralis]|uniref:C2H2-type domain-containing protein n=1 Tax=Characodon lateralis TaxID=208331 RepID=A0ABU7EYK9_9TELE|nr:hypothetical protein [Characodon lateralis]